MTRIISFLAKTQDFKGDSPRQSPRNKERGSAIIWIFVMIALFAALNFAVSKGTQTGISGMTDQQAKLAATEILDYSRAIKSAVHELQINGCKDTEISFENSFTGTNYANTNAPTDESCHIFKPNGGGLSYLEPDPNWLNESFKAGSPNNYGEWRFNGSWNYKDVGSSEVELAINLNFLKPDICIALNDYLGITNPSGTPPEETFDAGSGIFAGTYGTTVANGLGDDGGHDLAGKTAYCYKATATSVLQITQVLIAR